MTPLTTKAAEIRAGLVDLLREHVRSRGGLSRAPTYDAGLCCGHPDDCTFISPPASQEDTP